MKRHRVRAVGSLAFGVLVLGAALALFTVYSGKAAHEQPGRERILLARTSTDGHWSPCAPVPAAAAGYCRTAEEIQRSAKSWQLSDREARGEKDAERRPALESLFYRGSNHPEQAVSQLEALTLKKPREADLLIDLSAAQLTVGWAHDSAASFVDALESADRALEIKPVAARACFNRAFALGELGLREIAVETWARCARLENDPSWRTEALQRAELLGRRHTTPSREEAVAALEQAIRNGRRADLDRWARDQPQLATEFVIRELLPRWVESGPISQAAWWPGFEALAEGIGRSTEDRFLVDIDRQLRSGVAKGHGPEIAEGVRRLRRGLDIYRERRFSQAVSRLSASEASLQEVPALRMVARSYKAVALHSSGQIDASRQELSRLISEAGERRYHWPLGYAHWTLGRMAIIGGHPLAALSHYRQALHAFERIRAGELVLSANILLAETYGDLGQSELAWQFARRALLAAQRTGAEDRLFFVFNLFATVADDQGRSRLAFYAQTSALEHATSEPPRVRANAHLWHAYYLGRQGRHDAAQQDLAQAERLAREVDDPTESARVEAETALVRGVLATDTDPEAAVVSLEKAVHLFDQVGDRFVRLIALKTRAEALRKMGRVEEAAEDLKAAMAAYDAAVQGFTASAGPNTAEPERLTYLRQHTDVYQALTDLYVEDLAAPWEAMVFAEHAKSLRAPGTTPRLSIRDLRVDRWQEALPPKTALLSYSLAGEHVVAWVLTPTDRVFLRLGRFDAVVDLTNRLGRARDAATWEALSRELHRRLITPLGEPLRHINRLLLVPTPGLDRVPFPGLLDPQSGRYLAETYLLEMLPCASVLLHESGSAEGAAARNHALVIGDPRPTNAGFLGLASLRFAEEEARKAADLLGSDTVLLLGPEATPRRFIEAAPAAGLIHVAGHALSLGRGPDSAALVLATDAGDEDGLLTAQEILDLPLSGTELVVLSACSSAGGPVVSWQSGLTLGRSFLSAGAERVVATLHAVDDEESARLFEAFYRELAVGKGAAASLRNAQLSVLRWRSGGQRWKPPSWPYVIILESSPSNNM